VRSPIPAFVMRSVDVARSQLGVREVIPNRGARVVTYQKAVRNDRLAVGEPWCASFVTWVELQAKDPTPFRSAVVADWVRAARNNRFGMTVVSQRDARVGDLAAFYRDGGWQHMGIVSAVGGDTISVISGNTTGATRRAEGVYEKPLTNWTSKGYRTMFIRNNG
jgi:hypothetical protein